MSPLLIAPVQHVCTKTFPVNIDTYQGRVNTLLDRQAFVKIWFMVTLLNELQSEISSQVGDAAASFVLPKFSFGLETQDMIQDSRVSVNKEHEG